MSNSFCLLQEPKSMYVEWQMHSETMHIKDTTKNVVCMINLQVTPNKVDQKYTTPRIIAPDRIKTKSETHQTIKISRECQKE